MKTKLKFNVKRESLPESRVKLLVTVPASDFASLRAEAEKEVLKKAKLDGFREGKVPLNVFVSKFGEFPIWEEAGYMAVNATYLDALLGEKINAIGKPEISIQKLAVGGKDDFEYAIVVDVLPEVVLGDYKKYHEKVKLDEVGEVKDEEVAEALEELRQLRATKQKVKKESGEEVEETVLPELDGAFLKSVGNFASLDELKKKIKENILGEKRWRAEEKRKAAILDLLAAETECEVPKSLVQNELAKMESRISADLSQMGVSFDDYLKHLKKTKEEWQQSEWANAKKQVAIQLALHQIAKNENISVGEEVVLHEVNHLLETYRDLDRERVKAFVEERMLNTKVLEYLFTGEVPKDEELFAHKH